MMEEAKNSLTDTCQHPSFSDKIPPFPDELSVCHDPYSSSTSILPPPHGLIKQPAEGPADQTLKTQPSQCTTTESLSISFSADERATLEEQGEFEVPLPEHPATDKVAPEVKAEGDAADVEISQMDERRLKCLRTFQQILREKRETRRSLASMTMTFSQEEYEPGSHR
ncbi:hypothetical protein CesoFtcFv8_003285 [Champsocephalus esox]|uniref:Uncharacterized protein n=1 Tax=Champsocephalus esox TaxID=159716 RepID=A0AAN8CW81_9TELE|nr:hypothetical protein CesoFtcFv8_003285 [Champsocephalus esox]